MCVCVCVSVSQVKLQLFRIKPSEVAAGKAKSGTHFKDIEGKKKEEMSGGLIRAVCRSVSVSEG